MNKPKVSIIVPCYNVEKYVSRCLDSLINQTLNDIEILCVDDKSTDGTLNILQEYAIKDSRIKVIQIKQNSGVSVARNKGILIAKGLYIGFVDSDDYVDHDFYEKLYKKSQTSDADVIAGNIIETSLCGKSNDMTWLIKRFSKNKYQFNYTLWCAIYKTSFIKKNKISCPVGIITGEDTVFCVKVAIYCNKIESVFDTYYHYIRIPNSISAEYFSDVKIQSRINAAKLILNKINSINIAPQDYVTIFSPIFEQIALFGTKKTTKNSTKYSMAEATISLWKKIKYKQYFENIYNNIACFLICEDVDGLCEYAKTFIKSASITYTTLFNFIPFVRIKRNGTHIKFSIFGIPIFGIYKN